MERFGILSRNALAAAMMEIASDNWAGDMPLMSIEDRKKVSSANLSREEIEERNRAKSRQERRQIERLRRKGRA
ncbi:hypothetical protein KM176_16425 [Pseudooceanicola sp. CBS1P-1]|uniref:Uncharacterized protein n=1 Tax=Pseudooceanicola albus TaxID=2692189 RepID=A0A6L7G6H6_9RHOB|nr:MULTISPECIES: hypothetical protein [Pseudooceanicola]MBT9385461.1 hypothetical protein [Pseudooceanicola endophyticus]MXN19127.1 hypothetical protein [Pseudooceanicola albus]